MDEFKCDRCGGIFSTCPEEDAEAAEEAEATFTPEELAGGMVSVCNECYEEKAEEWMAEQIASL